MTTLKNIMASGYFVLFLLFVLSMQCFGVHHTRFPKNVLSFNRRHYDKNKERGNRKLKARSIFRYHSNDINQPIPTHHLFNHVTQTDQSSHSCHSVRSTDSLYSELPHKSLQSLHPYNNRATKQQKNRNRRRRHQQKLLKKFYDKYTEAYGILVLSTKSVPDTALRRACYVLRFLLADRKDVRKAFQRKGGRVVVLGKNHYIADLPEYKLFLQTQKHHPQQQQRIKQILKRFKNVPSNNLVSITTTTEENLLCYKNFTNIITEVNFVENVFNSTFKPHTNNHYHNSSYVLVDRKQNHLKEHPYHQNHNRHQQLQKQHRKKHDHNCHTSGKNKKRVGCRSHRRTHLSRDDITLKSLSIGILNIAVSITNPNLMSQLQKAYKKALLTGLWLNTDAANDVQSYFGEGVQSYYNANAYARPANGFNNDVNTRVKLKSHDPELYALVHEVFPCANNYVKRCGSRGYEAKLTFEMDCPIHRWKEK